MKTTATPGRKPQGTSAPYRMSASHLRRLLHSAKRVKTPPWPSFPPLRLTDRRYDLDTVTCPFCNGKASFQAELVPVVQAGHVAVRSSKAAIAAAFADEFAITTLVPGTQIHAVEKATLPVLPSIELVGVTSERQESGPLLRHQLSIEVTVSHTSEDGADTLLDAIVGAVRRRLLDAETGGKPIVLPDGAVALVELQATRWSVSAGGPSSVIRGAAIGVAVGADE